MSPDKAKEKEREKKKRLRQPLDPSPTMKALAEAPGDDLEIAGMTIRGVALHSACLMLSSNTTATTKQAIALATRFEAYLLTGKYEEGGD